jgi:hypothetical protein
MVLKLLLRKIADIDTVVIVVAIAAMHRSSAKRRMMHDLALYARPTLATFRAIGTWYVHMFRYSNPTLAEQHHCLGQNFILLIYFKKIII